jgi:transposase-like protein
MKCYGQLQQGMENVSDKTGDEIRKATQNITGRKYCSSCHTYQLLEGGKDVLISNGRHTRWKCAKCIKQISQRKYQSKEK